MARTLQQQLDDLDALIARREGGDGYDGYGAGADNFKFAPLEALYKRREQLQRAVGATTGGTAFSLAQFDERI